MTIDTRASTSLRGRAASAAPHASRTIRRLTLVLMVALLALLAGGQRAHAQTPTSFTGDGDTQAQYMTPGCFGSPSTAGTPCLIGTAGSGLATLGDSQFFFHYLLTQTVTLSQVTYTDFGYCAPTRGQMVIDGDPRGGTSAISMMLYGTACLQINSGWQFTGQFVASGVSGMFQGGSGSGSFSGMIVGDRPGGGGGCIMWSGTFVLVGL